MITTFGVMFWAAIGALGGATAAFGTPQFGTPKFSRSQRLTWIVGGAVISVGMFWLYVWTT